MKAGWTRGERINLRENDGDVYADLLLTRFSPQTPLGAAREIGNDMFAILCGKCAR